MVSAMGRFIYKIGHDLIALRVFYAPPVTVYFCNGCWAIILYARIHVDGLYPRNIKQGLGRLILKWLEKSDRGCCQ
jgi:hypothetical protein